MLQPEELYHFIPKKVEDWTSKDVEEWFTVHKIEISKEFSCKS